MMLCLTKGQMFGHKDTPGGEAPFKLWFFVMESKKENKICRQVPDDAPE